MTPRIDAIAKLLSCPSKGKDIRQAIAQSRRDACPATAGAQQPPEPEPESAPQPRPTTPEA